MRISFVLVFMFLWGCTSNGATNTMDIPVKEKKTVHQSGYIQAQNSSKELVAMLCSAGKVGQAKQLLQQYNVLLVKQSSPTILTLSWSDERSAKQVIQSLQKSNTVFCGIESNQTYITQ